MIFYLFPYAFMLMSLLLGSLLSANYKKIVFFGLLPAFLLVVLRGDTGTDTVSYLNILQNTVSDFYVFHGDVEFGFELLSKIILYFGGGERLTVLVLSGLSVILMAVSFSNTREDALVFFLLLFPLFFYDMTMNGLRYGISFSLAKIAYNLRQEKSKVYLMAFAIISIFFHVSGLLVLLLLIGRQISIKYLLPGILFSILVVIFYYDRLLYKLAAYELIQAPGMVSGTAPLILVFAIYMCCVVLKFKNIMYLTFLFSLELLFYVLAKFSYAGIRLQLLVLYVLCCALPDLEVMNSKRRVFFAFGILMIGLLGFSFKARNMIDGEGSGDSPFLPYGFVWGAK